MDNGRSSQINNSSNTQPFFTSGSGKPMEQEGSFQKQDDLNLANLSAELIGDSAERGHRNIASAAMQSKERHKNRIENPDSPELGKITEMVDIAMPPNAEAGEPPGYKKEEFANTNADQVLDISSYRAERDKIEKETLSSVKYNVHKFENDKISPAELDSIAWESTKAYLKNSFGRDIAA